MPNTERLNYLLSKHQNGRLTIKERVELMSLINESANEAFIKAYIEERLLLIENAGTTPLLLDESRKEERINALLTACNHVSNSPGTGKVHLLKTAWFKYAAAVIIILLGVVIYYIVTPSRGPGKTTVAKVQPGSSILPGSDKAMLTLSNGKQVQLSDATSETIQDGTLSIENNQGQLVYKNDEVVAINTMTTPKGGQYKLILADGTKVWLNAASSITYPTAFTGNKREVSITGEAYFEVTKDKSKPFYVKTIRDRIEVLGTSFNINAYEDEEGIATTLVDGAVKIDKTVLKPGEQYINNTVVKVNVDKILAWKNGLFSLDGLPLPQLMRMLERWYDIKVKYQGKIPGLQLRGEMQRELTLQEVLEILQEMHLKFKLEGKTLIVEE